MQNPERDRRRSWELAKLHPKFILLMFLMLMHDHFFAKFRGHFFLSISVSPIVQQLLTIMSDTQTFPFFNRNHILQMLAMYGATRHLIQALCCPRFFINQETNHRFMDLICRRVFFRIASKSEFFSCFQRCFSVLLTYPMHFPQNMICVKISDQNIVNNLKTIKQMLSICSRFLPDMTKAAILDISSADLSADQMKTYAKLYMIIIFCRLFDKQNSVFILLCEYFDLINLYTKKNRTDECLRGLRKHIEEKLHLQIASLDFSVYLHYIRHLSAIVLQPCEQSPCLINDSIKLLQNFFGIMKEQMYIYTKGRETDICCHEVCASKFFGYFPLLKEGNRVTLLEKLKCDDLIIPESRNLSFCIDPLNCSSINWLFPVLQNASLLNLPPQLLKYMEHIIFLMEKDISYEKKGHNQVARLLSLVFKFVEWSQSDHPHRHFILDCVSFMKETLTTKHPNLEIFLHLQKFQSQELMGFYDLFKKFQKFAHPSLRCSEPTERSLLRFFDLMHMVFSNEPFLRMIQEFLKIFELEIKSFEDKKSINERLGIRFSCEAESIFHQFLQKLVIDPQLRHMTQSISYFRLTNCDYCHKFLDHDNDNGLCKTCEDNKWCKEQERNMMRRR
jgi:hypothetical protein